MNVNTIIEGVFWLNISAWGFGLFPYAKLTKKSHWLVLGCVVIAWSFHMMVQNESVDGLLEQVLIVALGCGLGILVYKKTVAGSIVSFLFFILPFHLYSIAFGLWLIGESFWGCLVAILGFFLPSEIFVEYFEKRWANR